MLNFLPMRVKPVKSGLTTILWHELSDNILMQIKSFALIERDGLFLLIQENSLRWRGKWYLPGGAADKNETPEEAAIRETREEAGCEIRLNGVFYVQFKPSFLSVKLCIFYKAELIGETIKTSVDAHSMAAGWFSYTDAMRLPLRSNLKRILEAYQQNGSVIPNDHFNIKKGLIFT